MNSEAMRSVWNSDLPPAVLVVAKKVRNCLFESRGSDGLDGFDIAGAKARYFLRLFGTTKSRALTRVASREEYKTNFKAMAKPTKGRAGREKHKGPKYPTLGKTA